MHLFACFSFYFLYYSSQHFEMGLGKIQETTNQLSLALDAAVHPSQWLHLASAVVGHGSSSLTQSTAKTRKF